MGEINYCLYFSLAPGVGPKGFQKLIWLFGSAQKAWKGSSSDFKKAGVGKVNFGKFNEFRKTFDSREYLNKLRNARVEFIEYGSKFYPARLARIDSPPIGLFVRGNKKLLIEENLIAVVGARKITSYGRQVTENLVAELCSPGFIIVSGMALGVDGVAHESAIQAQGRTLAVLGCGVDCPYPRENDSLYEEIIDSSGLIISEYPLGMPGSQGTFPARNRIIAGISRAVLITEAAQDSGSLITAAHAVKQGKPVFAVPGPITSQMSKGTLELLKQGAVLVSSTNDILESLNIKHPSKSTYSRRPLAKLNKDEQRIIEVLEAEARTIDEISKLADIKIGKLPIVLSEMELKGLVRSSGGKFTAVFVVRDGDGWKAEEM